jgi:anti-anti-sigma factor
MTFFFIGGEAPAQVVEQGEDFVVLVAGGELDYAASPEIRAQLAEHVNTGMRRLVLDLSTVTFIDSTAIGALAGAAMRLQKLGGSLEVVCAEANERVLRIFEIAGVTNVITLHSSREEALSALAGVG